MRDRNRRAASKRAYYERNKEKLQAKARERYALERAKEPAKVDTVCRNTQHTVMGRDPERRRASKRAYYQRRKALLQQQARERMLRLRSSNDESARRARRLAAWSYRIRNYDRLRIKRLNMYRKRWMMKHGVSRFLRRFRARVQAEEGQLLEHWDHGTLSSLGPGRYSSITQPIAAHMCTAVIIRYTCLPPFHRPDAVGKNGVVFYVIFAPDEHAGIYLAWYQIKAIMRRYNLPKCALDLQSFITPEAAIASWSEFCRIAHDHRSAVPPLFPSHPFTLATYSEYVANLGHNSVYQGEGMAGQHDPAPLGPYTPPATPPRTPLPSISHARSPQLATRSAVSQQSSPPTNNRAALTSTYSSAQQTAAGNFYAARECISTPTNPLDQQLEGPRLRAGHSRPAASIVPSSMSSVESWLDATSTALGALDLRTDSSVAGDQEDGTSAHSHRYVVGCDGTAPQIFQHWRDAHSKYRGLKDGGHMQVYICQRKSEAAALRFIERVLARSS